MNLLSFRLAHQWYAINVQHIIEVLWMVYLESMPSSPPEILGMLTMKQVSMPVLDLRKQFELPEAPITLYTPIIAAQHENKHMAFLVDEVREVFNLNPNSLRPVEVSPYVSHNFESSGDLVRLLNLSTLINKL